MRTITRILNQMVFSVGRFFPRGIPRELLQFHSSKIHEGRELLQKVARQEDFYGISRKRRKTRGAGREAKASAAASSRKRLNAERSEQRHAYERISRGMR